MLYGLIGYPVKHSFSPAMHNAAFRACKIKAEYKLFEVNPHDLEDFLLNRKDVEGFNITIPHKVPALTLVKNLATQPDCDVWLTGAINTVKRHNGKLLCRNTDPEGFRKSLREDLKFNPQDKNVFMFGCGGAGRAVMAGLSKKPRIKTMYIYENNPEVVKSANKHFDNYKLQLGYEYKFISKAMIAEIIKECQLLVNASPAGMKANDPSVVDKILLHKDLFVYDVVYNRDTQLIKDAQKICRGYCGGLGMLLYQGAAAWEIWTKKKAPINVMRKALKEELKKLC